MRDSAVILSEAKDLIVRSEGEPVELAIRSFAALRTTKGAYAE
jgi:hypothetical protein